MEESSDREVGVGPYPPPWPDDPRFDPALLAEGDRRNVADHYRYWTVEAITTDLDQHRHAFHVAVENVESDMNIGSIVRSANAFLASEVHIVGRRRWNRRGAMVTDRYQHVRHHEDVDTFLQWAGDAGVVVIGIDNVPGSVAIEEAVIPRNCVLLFGQEGAGLSAEAQAQCESILHITQFGSTRSINIGAAAAIAMHSWVRQHVPWSEQ